MNIGLSTKKILGVKITVSPKENILEEVRKYLKSFNIEHLTFNKKTVKPLIIYTPNPEIINYAQNDDKFKKIVNSAQITIPDGIGVVLAMKRLAGLSIERIAGADLMENLTNISAEKGARIGLIGGEAGVALDVLKCLQKKYPGLEAVVVGEPNIEVKEVSGIRYQVLGIKEMKNNKKKIPNTKYLILNTDGHNGLETEKYFQNLVNVIVQKKISLLFVALGFPKQEYFINSIRYQVLSIKYDKPLILMGVGGSFDYISGRVQRAPGWMRNAGLEWFYRLIREPRRLVRQIRGGEFFIKVLCDK